VKLRLHTADMDQLSGAAAAFLQNGDLVLLKGSRGCALERLCELPVLHAARETSGGGIACF
jgi:UDP-N-acetylmuramyl pentapeptide synthase